MQLCDLLIKPVQRITKYQLLLREALRLTERTQRLSEIEGLRAAAHVMRVIPKAANDMMDVGRLQGFDVSTARFFSSLLLVLRGKGTSFTTFLNFLLGENNSARKALTARAASSIRNIKCIDERKGMASFSFRAKYYL